MKWFLNYNKSMQTCQPKNESGIMMIHTDVTIATDIEENAIILNKTGYYNNFLVVSSGTPIDYWRKLLSGTELHAPGPTVPRNVW